MRMLRLPFIAAAATIAFALLPSVGADAQTKVTIGKVVGGDGFHVPTYVALDEGFFKQEGLDVTLMELQANAQVTAVLSGNLDCAPIPSGGAQAALSGAKIMYIVGESLKSQWTLTTRRGFDFADRWVVSSRPLAVGCSEEAAYCPSSCTRGCWPTGTTSRRRKARSPRAGSRKVPSTCRSPGASRRGRTPSPIRRCLPRS